MPIQIVVDADACPVKNEIWRAASQQGISVLMVASYDHRIPEMDGQKVVYVDRSDQSVDLYISNYIQEKDIVVTQDMGLAAVALSKKAIVLSNRGQQYHNDSIDFLLDRRHNLAKQRRSGIYGKGPKKLTEQDRRHFLQSLTKVLQRLQENESEYRIR